MRKRNKRQRRYDPSEVKQWIRKRVQTFRDEHPEDVDTATQALHQQITMADNQYTGWDQTHQYFQSQQTIRAQQRRLSLLEKAQESFVDRAKPLLHEKESIPIFRQAQFKSRLLDQQRHALYLSLSKGSTAVPSYIDRDICQNCGTAFQTYGRESKSVCPNKQCGITIQYLKHQVEIVPKENDHRRTETDKKLTFRRYVTQFSTELSDPTEEELGVLVNALASMHIFTDVKPTRIAKIMRNAKLPHCAAMPVRIARIVNGEDPILFSSALIEKLVHRFDVYHTAQKAVLDGQYRDMPENVKLSSEFLLKHFLAMEDEQKLSGYFNIQKTRNVTINAERWFGYCCRFIRQNDDTQKDGLGWEHERTC